MPTIADLAKRLESYLSHEKINRVKRAYYFAQQAHEGQYRRSGEPYIIHPLAVANILADMHMDHQSLMAAMLHDVLEDTPVTKEHLVAQFGQGVAEIVDGVSKLTFLHFETKQEEQAENFQKMILAMAKDIRVILVKLADRLHNMRTLGVMPPHKKRRIARETLDIYAPIAMRLGIGNLRKELEDLCLASIYPMRAPLIASAVAQLRGNRANYVKQVQESVFKRLQEEGISAIIESREKHLFSIYEKMRLQGKSFEEIMDVYGLRIIVGNIDQCYRTLGVVHNFYKPIPNRFKDYIAIPKTNGYQSLHTTMIGPHGVPIEVQIRTKEMNEMAAHGIANHDLYKQNDSNDPHPAQARAHRWMKSLLEMQQRANSPIEFIENVKMDLFPDEIYVFTPKGRIMELPTGACAVDFAYAVHTDIGNACVGCLINREQAPLSQPLKSGDSIRILTKEDARPSPAWLDFVITAKARANIRHFLKHQQQHESLALGQKMLHSALQQLGSDEQQVSAEQWHKIVEHFQLNNKDQLLIDIGLGNRPAFMVARALITSESDSELSQHPLTISGQEGMVIQYAKCCRPIPGDPIIGIASKGKGLIIHVESCPNIAEVRQDAARCVPLIWDQQMQGEFVVDLRLEMENQRGALAAVAAAVAEAQANIEAINMEELDARISRVNISVSVTDRVHLARVIKRLKKIITMTRIARVKA